MRNLLHRMSLLAVLMVMSFAGICNAQTTVNIVQELPDGEYIVSINGQEQRTITPEHARRIAETNIEVDSLRRARANLESQVAEFTQTLALAQRESELASTQAALERERAERFSVLWEGEQNLRLQAERLIPRRGRVDAFFDNPIVQISSRAVVPAMQLLLEARRGN